MKKYFKLGSRYWLIDSNNVMNICFDEFNGISFYGSFKPDGLEKEKEISKEQFETELMKVIDFTISYL